ncbi:dienelactone hydrolase family protein [Bradyrhizobium macuxiense]|uniref:dienelactone hydrolase family protein n=1 Tax=Bradyrhizobium macuxiense TaxID=1755647 RepID=UPI001365DDEC|nr:dienelactone hydrolase family protein [Bradyrhizobium macuxiense]
MALAETQPTEVRIKWKGDYAHNSDKHWSKDNPYDSGFSKNFKNGTPQEFGDVQKDGELNGFVYSPTASKGPVPFVVVMHGCDGMTTSEKEWTAHVADVLNKEGFGALVLDSYTTRYVDNSCGLPDQHWGRRRADDAYSALDYLVDKKIASEVYVMGYSNGGLASLMAMTKKEADHPHHFAAGFPIAPNCYSVITKYGDYYAPMIVFTGDQDNANPPAPCHEMMKKKRATPIQLIEYQGANHGFLLNQSPRIGDHGWALTYNPAAEKNMMATIIAAIKTKKFVKGVDVRRASE